MKTGQDVNRPGVYGSECCLLEKELEKNQSFPRCPKCMKLTEWFPVVIGKAGVKDKAA